MGIFQPMDWSMRFNWPREFKEVPFTNKTVLAGTALCPAQQFFKNTDN